MMAGKLKQRLYQAFKSWYYRMQTENHIASQAVCDIHPSVKSEGLHIDGRVTIGENAVLRKAKLSGEINIGKKVKIDNSILAGTISISDHSKIIDGVELYGDIEIGKNTAVNGPNTDMRAALSKIVIGNFCSIARNVTFQEYNHDHTSLTTYMVRTNLENKHYKEDIVSKGAIEIGHDVWIGTHCVVLSGAKIGTGAVIAANSVVTGEIPPYAIAAGIPAKVLRYRFNEKIIDELLRSEWWDMSHGEIIELFNKFKAQQQ